MNVLALECSASMQPMRIEQHHMTMAGRQACRARTSSCAVATTRRSHTYTNLVPVLVRERPNMRHRQLARRLGTAQCSGPRRASLLGVGVVHLLRNGAAHPRASSPNQLSWQAVVANDGKVVDARRHRRGPLMVVASTPPFFQTQCLAFASRVISLGEDRRELAARRGASGFLPTGNEGRFRS